MEPRDRTSTEATLPLGPSGRPGGLSELRPGERHYFIILQSGQYRVGNGTSTEAAGTLGTLGPARGLIELRPGLVRVYKVSFPCKVVLYSDLCQLYITFCLMS